jgi:RNA polymerase sigma factor (sigma-70 family)
MTAPIPRRLTELAARDAFVSRLAAALIADPAAAADAAQDARVAFWRAAAREEAGGPEIRDPSGLLRRMVSRFAANRRRAAARRRLREHLAARREGQSPAAVVVEREEARARLWAAVDALPAPQREAVQLRWFDGRPPREVARALGVSVETVKSRLRRALAALRETLERDGAGRDRWIPGVAALVRPEALALFGSVGPLGLVMKVFAAAALLVIAALALRTLVSNDPPSMPVDSAPSISVVAPEAPSSLASDDLAEAPLLATPYRAPAPEESSFLLAIGAARRPLVGVEAFLARANGTVDRATSDAFGIVRFAVDGNAAQLAVAAPHRPAALFAVRADPGLVELLVADGETLHGRVLIDGGPPGRSVGIRVGGVRAPGRAPKPSGALDEAMEASCRSRFRSVVVDTAVDGTFAVEGLESAPAASVFVEPLDPWLEVEPSARGNPDEREAALRRNGAAVTVPLVALNAAVGRLADADGAPPPAGLVVEARAWTRLLALGDASARSFPVKLDPDGRFSVPMPRGPRGEGPFRLTLEARHPASPVPALLEIPLQGVARTDLGELRLPARRAVRFHVLDASGAPLSAVRFDDVDEAKSLRASGASPFELFLPRGERRLRIAAEGHGLVVAIVADADRESTVRLPKGGRVSVRVVDAEGRPTSGHGVTLRHAWPAMPKAKVTPVDALVEKGHGYTDLREYEVDLEQVTTTLTTDADGCCGLRGLPPGSRVTARFPEAPPEDLGVSATVGGTDVVELTMRTAAERHEYGCACSSTTIDRPKRRSSRSPRPVRRRIACAVPTPTARCVCATSPRLVRDLRSSARRTTSPLRSKRKRPTVANP